MIFIHMIGTNEMLKLTLGQGHKVKGQGQICNLVKETYLHGIYRTSDLI